MSLPKNTKAPNFKSQLHNGNEFELSKVNSKFIILYFYPKDDTSGCTAQACSLRDNLARVEKYGAKIFGISKDKLRSHQKFVEKYSLNFPLILDDKAEVCYLYDVMKEKSMYGRKYLGIERTTYILDKNLNILEVMEKVDPKTHTEDLIQILEKLS